MVKKLYLIMIIIYCIEICFIAKMPDMQIGGSSDNSILKSSHSYDSGRNIFGNEIFKNRKKADAQFRIDYAEQIQEIEQKFNIKYDTDYTSMTDFKTYSWQMGNAKDYSEVTCYAIIYLNSEWKSYIPGDVKEFFYAAVFMIIFAAVNIVVLTVFIRLRRYFQQNNFKSIY